MKVASQATRALLLYLCVLILTPASFIFWQGLSLDRIVLLTGVLLVMASTLPRFFLVGVQR